LEIRKVIKIKKYGKKLRVQLGKLLLEIRKVIKTNKWRKILLEIMVFIFYSSSFLLQNFNSAVLIDFVNFFTKKLFYGTSFFTVFSHFQMFQFNLVFIKLTKPDQASFPKTRPIYQWFFNPWYRGQLFTHSWHMYPTWTKMGTRWVFSLHHEWPVRDLNLIHIKFQSNSLSKFSSFCYIDYELCQLLNFATGLSHLFSEYQF
jgi:hypothetical protein